MAALITHNKKVYVDQPATCVFEPLTLDDSSGSGSHCLDGRLSYRKRYSSLFGSSSCRSSSVMALLASPFQNAPTEYAR